MAHLETLLHLAPWSAFMDDTDPDASWEGFLDILEAAIHDSIPRKQRRRTKCSPWITPELKKLIHLKHKLFTKAKHSGTISAWLQYKQIRNKVKYATKTAYWNYVNCLFATRDNKRSFWCFVRDQRKSKCPPAFQYADKLLQKPTDIAQAFNEFFTSVHSPAETCPVTPPPCTLHIPELPPIQIELGWLTKSLHNLAPHKAPGPDGISPTVLRSTASFIAPPLLHLMNSSLAHGTLPVAWKLSNVTPVFKTAKRSDIKNYRPIALTSIVCKVIERAVADSINDHVSSCCLGNEDQHGFTQRKSCVTQLTNAIFDWASIMDKPRPPRIDIAFLDFSKAFDVMPHHTLLNKLARNFNIQGQTWSWLKSFLTGRHQRVMYQGAFSSWSPATSSVPQESVLGPLLFNLFISDISQNLATKSLLFADDTLIYQPICSRQDELLLQADLDALGRWSESNGMKLNTNKSIMHMTRSTKTIALPQYSIHGLPLTIATTYKYLGITINNSLTWNDHVNSVVAKANRTLGFIWHTAGGTSTKALMSLYRSLVIPVLEYGLPAWCPYTAALSSKIERVQRRATRMFLKQHKGAMSYENRLQKLNWQSLESRRQRLVIQFTTKCLFGLIDCRTVNSNTFVNTRHMDTLSFNHLYARTLSLKNTSIHSFPRIWSSLPTNVKNSLIVDSFKCFNVYLCNHFLDV